MQHSKSIDTLFGKKINLIKIQGKAAAVCRNMEPMGSGFVYRNPEDLRRQGLFLPTHMVALSILGSIPVRFVWDILKDPRLVLYKGSKLEDGGGWVVEDLGGY